MAREVIFQKNINNIRSNDVNKLWIYKFGDIEFNYKEIPKTLLNHILIIIKNKNKTNKSEKKEGLTKKIRQIWFWTKIIILWNNGYK